MQTADQAAVAAIFNDLYAKTDALSALVAAQAAQIATLQAASDAHSATFDVSQVTGYTPPAATIGAADASLAAAEVTA